MSVRPALAIVFAATAALSIVACERAAETPADDAAAPVVEPAAT